MKLMRKRHFILRELVNIAAVGIGIIAYAAPVLAADPQTVATTSPSMVNSKVQAPAAATNAVADLYVRYTEPRADDATTASLSLLVDSEVNREELLVVLDGRAIATEQLGAPLRVLAGAHRVRVEQLCANGVRSQSEFSFTVGPGDRYEHTIAVSAVLAPSVLRARGCCASTPNTGTAPPALLGLAALLVGWVAHLRARARLLSRELSRP